MVSCVKIGWLLLLFNRIGHPRISTNAIAVVLVSSALIAWCDRYAQSQLPRTLSFASSFWDLACYWSMSGFGYDGFMPENMVQVQNELILCFFVSNPLLTSCAAPSNIFMASLFLLTFHLNSWSTETAFIEWVNLTIRRGLLLLCAKPGLWLNILSIFSCTSNGGELTIISSALMNL